MNIQYLFIAIVGYFFLSYLLFIFVGKSDVAISNAVSDELLTSYKIDILRGILAYFVVLGHGVLLVNFTIGKPWWPSLLSFRGYNNLAAIAVDCFFILTGYLFYKYNNGNVQLLSFFKKRFLRIYPAYLVSIVLVLIYIHDKSNITISDTLNLALFNTAAVDLNLSKYHAALYFHYWSLKIEILFYMIFPVIIWLNKYLSGILKYLFLMGMAVVFDYHFIYFALGFLIHSYQNKWLFPSFFTHWTYGLFSVPMLILYNYASFNFHSVVFLIIKIILYTIFFIFILRVKIPLKFLHLTRPYIFLGKVSYSLYLTHGLSLVLTYEILKFLDYSFIGITHIIYSMPIITMLTLICFYLGEVHYLRFKKAT